MAMDLKSYIGLEVRAARKRKGLTQEQLAEKIDRAVETISNLERGRTWTGLKTLETLSRVLEQPIQTFFPADTLRLSGSPDARKLELELAEIATEMNRKELAQLVRLARAMNPK